MKWNHKRCQDTFDNRSAVMKHDERIMCGFDKVISASGSSQRTGKDNVVHVKNNKLCEICIVTSGACCKNLNLLTAMRLVVITPNQLVWHCQHSGHDQSCWVSMFGYNFKIGTFQLAKWCRVFIPLSYLWRNTHQVDNMFSFRYLECSSRCYELRLRLKPPQLSNHAWPSTEKITQVQVWHGHWLIIQSIFPHKQHVWQQWLQEIDAMGKQV